jgi:AraC-like DNA-binding protein
VILDLARQHLVQLAQAADLNQGDGALLAENVCNLLAVATAPDAGDIRASGESKLEFMLAVARQHLADPELSPEKLAALCGISVRTLHLRFRQLGTSCGRWILNHRLAACREALADPRQQDCAISAVAFRVGFNDLSHFNKSFRRRYGMTPGQWRRER